MKPLKVMHVIHELGPGGAERVVLNYLKWHTRPTFHPHICVLRKIDSNAIYELRSLNVPVAILGKRPGFDPTTFLLLANKIRLLKVDILHLHNFSAVLYGTLASFLSKTSLIFSTDHNMIAPNRFLPSKFKSRFKGTLGIFHHRIIAVSDAVLQSQLEFHPYLRSKYTRIYNGIERVPSVDKRRQNALRQEFKLSSDSIVISMIAGMSHQKGHPVFFNAAKHLVARLPSVRFLVVGDGPRRTELEAKVEKMKLGRHVIFTGIRQDIDTILSITTVFTLSSYWEGLPITILEAMSAGVPIVATDVGGNAEAILHGKTGYLVPPGDSKAIASSILTLLHNEPLLKQISRNSKDRFETFFSASSMVKRTEALYLEGYHKSLKAK